MTNWIKCSERLPERIQESVLAFGTLEDESAPAVHEAYTIWNGKWFSVRSKEALSSEGYVIQEMTIHNVTHWQPLPEAPNED